MEPNGSVSPTGNGGVSDVEKFLCERLVDQSQPISERFRALFSPRNLKGPGPRNALILVSSISAALKTKRSILKLWIMRKDCVLIFPSPAASRNTSNLLAHEAAFALGQMQDAEAVPALEYVLNDMSLHPIVRHELTESLGAIGLAGNAEILKRSLVLDPAQEELDTTKTERSPFVSVDPAAHAAAFSSVHQLRQILPDEIKGMYERYAALFALSNHGG
ncbi:hypothetical protein DY000_02027757, partial [Brassica cretica]